MKKQVTHCLFMFKIECTMIILAILFAPNHSTSQFRTKFVNLNFEGLGKPAVQSAPDYSANQFGAGINVCAGGKHLHLVLEYDYNRVNLQNKSTNEKTNISFSEFYLGVRYYPIRPTFIVGNTAVRLTAGYLYGLDMEPNWRSLVTAGLAFSSVTNTSGVSLNVVYRPDTLPIKSYTFGPAVSLRLGIVLGPKG